MRDAQGDKTKIYTLSNGTYTISNDPNFKPSKGYTVTKIWRKGGYCWFMFDPQEATNVKMVGIDYMEE